MVIVHPLENFFAGKIIVPPICSASVVFAQTRTDHIDLQHRLIVERVAIEDYHDGPAVAYVRAQAYAPAPGITEKRAGDQMSGDRSHNLQDAFLNCVRKEKMPVTIFLVNGVKLQGVITWFDSFCVLLRRDSHSQLVYKHAISTIMPAQPVQLFDTGNEEVGED